MLGAYRSLVAVVLAAVALVGTFAQEGSAQPFAAAVAGDDVAVSAITPVHGFHCRNMPGWDARAGVYRYHRHDGICKNYQRCVAQHRRCSIVLGRGWESWQIERWGFDNWRYTECMMRNGCY